MSRRASQLWPIVFSVPLGLLAAVCARYAVWLPILYTDALDDNPSFRLAFQVEGVQGLTLFLAGMAGLGAVVFLVGFFLGLKKRLAVIRRCYIAAYGLGVIYLGIVSKIIWHIVDYKLPVRGIMTTSVTGFFWWYQLLWPAAVAMAFLGFLHLQSWRRQVINAFTGSTDTTPAMGDLVLENLRTHGRDPVYRKSIFSSLGVHVMVIVVLPWMLSMRGCVTPYRVPKGSGTPTGGGSPQGTGIAQQLMQVKVVKAKKKKKRKLLVNPHSAISFHMPDLDDAGIDKNVEQAAQVTYQADTSRVQAMGAVGKNGPKGVGGRGTGGGLGAGGGTTGGWPDGMDNALVRFIRLEYSGGAWDTGMGGTLRSDINFLQEFHNATGFKVAAQGESHPIGSLRKYPKGFAPPFVFMTGDGSINVSATDLQALREYLLDGGLLFVNCASAQFDRSFRSFIQQVLPGNPLLVIADDDPIFQVPYAFPNGAPPLWHHGGMRALGVKYNNRWVVFYHPGDILDAWSTGHAGLDPRLVTEAYDLGVNVIYYSFTHYLELTRKYRK